MYVCVKKTLQVILKIVQFKDMGDVCEIPLHLYLHVLLDASVPVFQHI